MYGERQQERVKAGNKKGTLMMDAVCWKSLSVLYHCILLYLDHLNCVEVLLNPSNFDFDDILFCFTGTGRQYCPIILQIETLS